MRIPITSQMPNRSHAVLGNPHMVYRQETAPRIVTGQTNGTRNGRGRSGSVYCNASTPTQTMVESRRLT